MDKDMDKDKHLLMGAAKAAGMSCMGWYVGEHFGMYTGDGKGVSYARWNPLADDGDALRLAVDLALEIRPAVGMVTAAGNGVWEEVATADYTRQEATRRAIVQAAALLGLRAVGAA